MNFNILIYFIILTSILPTITANEQQVTIEAEISEHTSWLYSENTKHTIIGITITIISLLICIGLYYLAKLLLS